MAGPRTVRGAQHNTARSAQREAAPCQTPARLPPLHRPDECERVKACGARVLTLDQIEGLKDPSIDCWTTEEEDDGDPPRLWFPNGMYPGTAFTRSIGDAGARGPEGSPGWGQEWARGHGIQPSATAPRAG